jgi:hypothetical protein
VLRERGRIDQAPLGDLPQAVTDEVQLPFLAASVARARWVGGSVLRLPVRLWFWSLRSAVVRWLQRAELGGAMRVRQPRPKPNQLLKHGDQKPGERSSRTSAQDAGWPVGDSPTIAGSERQPRDGQNRPGRASSPLIADTLLASANARLGKLTPDLVNETRQRWMATQRSAGVLDRFPGLVIGQAEARCCLILGNPACAIGRQPVIEPMLAIDQQLETDFTVVLGNVNHRARDVTDYVSGFYEAFPHYQKPILALPGGGDWYDGLRLFMFCFCDADPLPATELDLSRSFTPERAARWLWRRNARSERPLLRQHQLRRGVEWKPLQPGPYWAMDMAGVRLIAIDTGITGSLDRQQGEWLLLVSAGRTPKVLLSGKGLWADGEYRPTEIDWGPSGPPQPGMRDVDDIVRCRDHHYVAAIGNGTHNYQRLTVTITDPAHDEAETQERRIEYVVAGGSGASMNATHKIGRVDEGPQKTNPQLPSCVHAITDADFRCYPTRGDSLAYHARWFGERLAKGFAIAIAALAVSLATVVGWSALGEEPAHGLLPVMLATAAGFLAIPLVITACAALARHAYTERYRTLGVLLIVPAATALAAVGLDALLGEIWDWAWVAALLGLATALLSLLLILISYGLASARQTTRQLTVAVLVVAAVTLYFGDVSNPRAAALTLALPLLALAVLLHQTTGGRNRLFDAENSHSTASTEYLVDARERPRHDITLPVTLCAVSAAVLIRFWDAWAARDVLAAILVLIIVTSSAAAALIALGGRHALLEISGGGGLDADKALSYLHYLGIAETLPDEDNPQRLARVGDFDYRTARICDFLLPGPRGPRAWLNWLTTLITRADAPPTFRSFVSLQVERRELVLTCHGVTGRPQHATDVPREDCVRIRLPPN